MNEDLLIRQIAGKVQIKEFWNFGSELGVPLDRLRAIIDQGRENREDSSASMYRIFSCWHNHVVDHKQRSWRGVLKALRHIRYNALANDIEEKLTRMA